jgi:hypothetical protein
VNRIASDSAPYTLSTGAPRYWYPANPPKDRGWARRGRRARYSFVERAEDGRLVRRWHRDLSALPAQHEASLRGMVKP